MTALTGYSRDSRIRAVEWALWLLPLAVFALAPDYVLLGARILIFILMALSLDLVLGFAGIITLGQAAFFGAGAYAVGIASTRYGISQPFVQLGLGVLAGAATGALTGALVLRTRGLTLLMLTLAMATILQEIANKAGSITGGADGLSGIRVDPLFGLFRFDLYGKTAYLYCLGVVFLCWLALRRLLRSPYGAMLTALRDNPDRMAALGAPVYRRRLSVYTLAAALAGLAGALFAQVNHSIGLNAFGFEISGDTLVMLILGGVGRLYGALIGPLAFLLAQDVFARQSPEYWYLGLGLLLIGVALFARGGILGLAERLLRRRAP